MQDPGRVRKLAQLFENNGSLPTSYDDSNINYSNERHHQNRERSLNREQNFQNKWSSSNVDVASNTFSRYEPNRMEQYESSHGRSEGNIPSVYINEAYGINPNIPQNNENITYKKKVPYLGKSFEDFQKNLGLSMSNFSDYEFDEDDDMNRISMANKDIYRNAPFVGNNEHNSNMNPRNPEEGSRSSNIYNEPYNRHESTYSPNEPSYEHEEQAHSSKHSESLYGPRGRSSNHRNENIYEEPHNSSSSDDNIYDEVVLKRPQDNFKDKSVVIVKSEYDIPADISTSPYNENSSANNERNSYRERQPSISSSDLDSSNHQGHNEYNENPRNNDQYRDYSEDGRSKKGFFNFFRRNKKDNSREGMNKYEDISRKMHGKPSRRYAKETNLLELRMFNEYQNSLFLNRIPVVSHSRIKKMFKKSSHVSVMRELELITGQCLAKSMSTLTNDIMMTHLCFRNLEMLKNYKEVIVNKKVVHKFSNKFYIDISPMIYEADRTLYPIVNLLPNIYALNMTEFILTSPNLSIKFKQELKKGKEKYLINEVDIILLLSNSYFKVINKNLVNHIFKFIETNSEVHLIHYYLGVLMSFAPFIKPAIKIYFDNYSILNSELIRNHVKNIIKELLKIANKWMGAFQGRYTEQNFSTNAKVLQVLLNFSNKRKIYKNENFKSLENILYQEKILKDSIREYNERNAIVNRYIMMYVRNIYDIFVANRMR
ncbi:conserved Plasmodium protein, unknown function [Plasmodium relictum]|uniref:Uncharacterized protein n=1 Tax=Plasmodium relictum TaxID=85471 RepID=A0A1J1HG91_PLARL|nr:conserved Plasmodium protein, unknown function [Plasmodium relictum]CRH02861.1 conserved Plasmodium protein, unknown function [Plasmodium relictum]